MRNKYLFGIVLISALIIIGGIKAIISDFNEPKKVQVEENIDKEEEVKEEKVIEISSIEDWLKEHPSANYDKENKTMYITMGFLRNLSLENRIFSANVEIYEVVKELEELFPNEIELYKINFEADTLDKYGNKNTEIVYYAILNRNELNKVNWEGIEPSMLINLASIVYKSPVLNTID